jgi:hypothetical protein
MLRQLQKYRIISYILREYPAAGFIAVALGKPFFAWLSRTHMHFRAHVKEELRGISDNTTVFYSTDNGPQMNT